MRQEWSYAIPKSSPYRTQFVAGPDSSALDAVKQAFDTLPETEDLSEGSFPVLAVSTLDGDSGRLLIGDINNPKVVSYRESLADSIEKNYLMLGDLARSDYLNAIDDSDDLTFTSKGVDAYKRRLGDLRSKGEPLVRRQVRQGLAVVWKPKAGESVPPEYEDLVKDEAAAKEAKLNFWKDPAGIRPSDWRASGAGHLVDRPLKDPFEMARRRYDMLDNVKGLHEAIQGIADSIEERGRDEGIDPFASIKQGIAVAQDIKTATVDIEKELQARKGQASVTLERRTVPVTHWRSEDMANYNPDDHWALTNWIHNNRAIRAVIDFHEKYLPGFLSDDEYTVYEEHTVQNKTEAGQTYLESIMADRSSSPALKVSAARKLIELYPDSQYVTGMNTESTTSLLYKARHAAMAVTAASFAPPSTLDALREIDTIREERATRHNIASVANRNVDISNIGEISEQISSEILLKENPLWWALTHKTNVAKNIGTVALDLMPVYGVTPWVLRPLERAGAWGNIPRWFITMGASTDAPYIIQRSYAAYAGGQLATYGFHAGLDTAEKELDVSVPWYVSLPASFGVFGAGMWWGSRNAVAEMFSSKNAYGKMAQDLINGKLGQSTHQNISKHDEAVAALVGPQFEQFNNKLLQVLANYKNLSPDRAAIITRRIVDQNPDITGLPYIFYTGKRTGLGGIFAEKELRRLAPAMGEVNGQPTTGLTVERFNKAIGRYEPVDGVFLPMAVRPHSGGAAYGPLPLQQPLPPPQTGNLPINLTVTASPRSRANPEAWNVNRFNFAERVLGLSSPRTPKVPAAAASPYPDYPNVPAYSRTISVIKALSKYDEARRQPPHTFNLSFEGWLYAASNAATAARHGGKFSQEAADALQALAGVANQQTGGKVPTKVFTDIEKFSSKLTELDAKIRDIDLRAQMNRKVLTPLDQQKLALDKKKYLDQYHDTMQLFNQVLNPNAPPSF